MISTTGTPPSMIQMGSMKTKIKKERAKSCAFSFRNPRLIYVHPVDLECQYPKFVVFAVVVVVDHL